MSQKLVGILTMVTLLVSGCTDRRSPLPPVDGMPVPSAETPVAVARRAFARVEANRREQALAGRAATDIDSARAGSQFAPDPRRAQADSQGRNDAGSAEHCHCTRYPG